MIINTGIMLERLTNGTIPIGWHRVVAAPGYDGERYSVVQFCHPAMDDPVAGSELLHARATPAVRRDLAADALDEVLYEINLVETARRA